MSQDNELEFDPNNFCVRIEGTEDKDRIERALKPLRPDDWEFPDAEITLEPYWGVRDGELTQSALEWIASIPLPLLMVNIIAYKLKQVIEKSGGRTMPITIHKWSPKPGDMILGSMTGSKYSKAIYMYYVEDTQRHYCVPLNSIKPSELETGQKIIKLTAYKKIRPIVKE